MMRRVLPLLLLLLAACVKPPVRDAVTIEFNDKNDNVTITAQTELDINAKTDEARARVETAQRLAESGMDPWSARMRRVDAESEQLVFHRQKGKLDRVTRTIVISSSDLQRVFTDINVTMNVTRADDYRELAIYSGTSARASRDEQRKFENELQVWSKLVASYLVATHHYYSYLDANPQRAEYLIRATFDEKEREPVVTEEEKAVMDAFGGAMAAILDRVERQDKHAQSFGELADLMFNPFPARFEIRVPGDVIAREGFDEKLVIEPVDLLASIAALEGRWVSPDILGLAMREEKLTAEQILAMPRKSKAAVDAGDVARALRETLARPKQFVIRWED